MFSLKVSITKRSHSRKHLGCQAKIWPGPWRELMRGSRISHEGIATMNKSDKKRTTLSHIIFVYIYMCSYLWVSFDEYILRYSRYIVHYTTLPLLEKRRLTCLWRGMWVFGNRLCLRPNFGLFRYSKLTRFWNRINICTVMMWYLAKNMTQLLKPPTYIYNYGELLLWQLSDHICLTQWSLASSLVLSALS